MDKKKKIKPQKGEPGGLPTIEQLEKEMEMGPNLYCLMAAGKILVTLVIAYQVLQLMGRHVMKEYRERLFVDESMRRNVLPANESLVIDVNKTLTVTPASCLTGQKLRKPLVKDSKLVYHLASASLSRHYNFSVQLAGDHYFDCLLVEIISHSYEIKYGIGDSEFKSDMPVEKHHFSGLVSK